jgi:hypothetical protein
MAVLDVLRALGTRRVIIWPDHDTPGYRAAQRLLASYATLGIDGVIWDPVALGAALGVSEVPEGWDAADVVHPAAAEILAAVLADPPRCALPLAELLERAKIPHAFAPFARLQTASSKDSDVCADVCTGGPDVCTGGHGGEIRAEISRPAAYAVARAYGEPPEYEPPEQLAAVPAPPYPLDALPAELRDVVKVITDAAQVAPEQAATAVLGATAVAVQGIADVSRYPWGGGPVSLFVLMISPSGARKSSTISMAAGGISRYARHTRLDWEDEQQGEDGAKGAGKERYVHPTIKRTTLEGLIDCLGTRAALGLVSDEAGTQLHGHAMSTRDRRVDAFVSALCDLWSGPDGSSEDVRRGASSSVPEHARVSIAWGAQPCMLGQLLRDPIINGSGWWARMLVCEAPALRLRVKPDASLTQAQERTLDQYHARQFTACGLSAELSTPAQLRKGKGKRRILEFGPRAARARAEYMQAHDDRQPARSPDVRRWYDRVGEHASRLAAVLTLAVDPDATEITVDAWTRGAQLADYYGLSLARLLDDPAAAVSGDDMDDATRLDRWLQDIYPDDLVTVRQICRWPAGGFEGGGFGPRRYRRLLPDVIIPRLVDSGRLLPAGGGLVPTYDFTSKSGEAEEEGWVLIKVERDAPPRRVRRKLVAATSDGWRVVR